ncbi:MAG: hypothetical protein H6662_02825 [Ardenticatenaceae bacterium]|nr:hypothetical protein [Ardenticatenaceae bacterium]
METHERAGMAGPTVESTTLCSHQPHRLPSLWVEFLRRTMLSPVSLAEMRTAMRNETRRVTITGAALCVRHVCLAQIGPLDEQIFMFTGTRIGANGRESTGWGLWFVTLWGDACEGGGRQPLCTYAHAAGQPAQHNLC